MIDEKGWANHFLRVLPQDCRKSRATMPPIIDPTKPIQIALMIEKPKSVFCGVNISEIR
jgi:hypothetical protein